MGRSRRTAATLQRGARGARARAHAHARACDGQGARGRGSRGSCGRRGRRPSCGRACLDHRRQGRGGTPRRGAEAGVSLSLSVLSVGGVLTLEKCIFVE